MNMNEIKSYVDMAIENRDLNILSYLVTDINETIKFIEESSDLEFSILADYFEQVAFMSESKDFIEAIRSRFIKMTDNSLDLKYICDSIKYAEDVFEEEEY